MLLNHLSTLSQTAKECGCVVTVGITADKFEQIKSELVEVIIDGMRAYYFEDILITII